MKTNFMTFCGWRININLLVERINYLVTLLSLIASTVVITIRLEKPSYEAKLLLTCLTPSIILLIGILGALFKTAYKDIHVLRLVLKVIFLGMALTLYRLGTETFIFKELIFYILQIASIRTEAASHPSHKLTPPQLAETVLLLVAGLVSIALSLDNWITCLLIGLSCLSLIVKLLTQLIKPAKMEVKINFDLSPVQPTELMSNRVDRPGLNLISPERLIQIRPSHRGMGRTLSRKNSAQGRRHSNVRKGKRATDFLRNVAGLDNSFTKRMLFSTQVELKDSFLLEAAKFRSREESNSNR